MGAWWTRYPEDPDFSGAIEPDPAQFITGGQSLYLRMDTGKGVAAAQNLTLKPDTASSGRNNACRLCVMRNTPDESCRNVGHNQDRRVRGSLEWSVSPDATAGNSCWMRERDRHCYTIRLFP